MNTWLASIRSGAPTTLCAKDNHEVKWNCQIHRLINLIDYLYVSLDGVQGWVPYPLFGCFQLVIVQ